VDEPEKSLRRDARWRPMVLPGAGFALLGYPAAALVSFALAAVFLASTVIVSFAPSAPAAWLSLVSLIGAALLWTVEYVVVSHLPVRTEGAESVVSRHFGAACAVTYVGLIAASACVIINFGTLVVAGEGMAPVVYPGERMVYHKRAGAADLVKGALVAFRVSPDSSWARDGSVVIARILAVPGNDMAIRDGHYQVNGVDTGVEVATVGSSSVVVDVPDAPARIAVPPDCFFVVQEQPAKALDSRTLSWARRDKIVGTRLWLLSSRGLGQALR
jgi:signal peptidase I